MELILEIAAGIALSVPLMYVIACILNFFRLAYQGYRYVPEE